MFIDEKIKLPNKDRVQELQEQICFNLIGVSEIPHDILTELFINAITRINEKENSGEFDERDWKDKLCDCKNIIGELFDALQKKIDFDIYE